MLYNTTMNERIKNYLGIALILGTLSVAYVGINFATSYQPYPTRTFSVSGEGEVVAIPDVGRFSFSVLSEGPELEKLQKENTEKSNAIIAFLKKQGVEEKDLKSESYNIYPTYQYYDCNFYGVCPPAKISGYRVEHSISITVRNLENAGTFLSGVIENGANTASSLNFEVDDIETIKDGARTVAIAKAREKAKSMAAAGEFRIGKMVSIYEEAPYYNYDEYGGGQLMEEAPYPSPNLEPGSQKVIVRVDISYEIK